MTVPEEFNDADRARSARRRSSDGALDLDDALGPFQDSLQSFPPEHSAPWRQTLPQTVASLPDGDFRRATWVDRAVWVVATGFAIALIAGAIYVRVR